MWLVEEELCSQMVIAYQVTDPLEVKFLEDKCNIQVGTYRIAW